MMTLVDWRRTWIELGLPSSDADFADLAQRYGEPHRAYHTMQHLRECFAHFETARHLAEKPAEVEIALWLDRKSTRLNSSHIQKSRMPSSA